MKSVEKSYSPTFPQVVMRWLYTLVLTVITPFAAINLWVKAKNQPGVCASRQWERFGLVPVPEAKYGYLFHCVSVGEVVAASGMIKQIMKNEPEISVTITTTTATGSDRVKAIFGDTVNHSYLPFDLPVTMNAMLKRVAPKVVLITEVELWPNLIHNCWLQRIPVIVVNARMTDRSASRYAKISALFEPMLQKVSHVCAQGERDFANYQKLGIGNQKITLTNNIKFDQAFAEQSNADFMAIKKSGRKVVVGGSTHEPEEQALLDTYCSLSGSYPELLLIIVPRHPERFDTVARLLGEASVRFVRSSQTKTLPEGCDVVLLDEMGKLNQAYQVADYSFVGGSLADRGGHNALEPAAVGLPIITGPHIYNNPVICQYLTEKGALTIIQDTQDMQNCLRHWLEHPSDAHRCGLAGQEVIQENSGALEKTLACLARVVR